jgi:hypothetical protein
VIRPPSAAGHSSEHPFGVDVANGEISHWLEWGQLLFWISALIWILVLVPTQRRLVAAREVGRKAGALPPEFTRLSARWAMWGGIEVHFIDHPCLLILRFLSAAEAHRPAARAGRRCASRVPTDHHVVPRPRSQSRSPWIQLIGPGRCWPGPATVPESVGPLCR